MLEKEDMQHKNLISTRPKAHEACSYENGNQTLSQKRI